jgi:hypothetical protein
LAILVLGCCLNSCGPAVKPPGAGAPGSGTGTPSRQQPGKRSTAESDSSFHFEDRAPSAGVEFIYQNGSEANRASILESLGGGCGVFDFDRDQDLDVFFPGGGKYSGPAALQGLPSALYRNETGWQFQPVTSGARIGEARHYTHGTAIADYDQDGFEDVLVTGYGGLQLWQNAGDGTFRDATDKAKLTDKLWSSSAAWGDINEDGNLDLYVSHYVNWSFTNNPVCPGPEPGQRETCSPRRFEPMPHIFYQASGDGTFIDASASVGLRSDGKGLGVMTADFDLDGHVDIYVANDTVPNFLYRNQGNGKLEEIGALSNTALSENATADGSMGVAVGDYNNDGLPDIWVSNYERETSALYRNEGNCFFLHVSQPMGITAVGSLFVGFGTVFGDLDRDGNEDIWVTNGHVIKYPQNAPLRQVPLLFANRNTKRFVNVAPQSGKYCTTPHMGRGVAKGDLDGDGDLDLVSTHTLEPHALLENTSQNENGWLAVRCIGTRSNRSAIGTRLTLKTSTGVRIRQISGGGSYLSHSDLTPFWGIPKGTKIEELTVQWPSGATQKLTAIKANQTLVVVEVP